MQNDEVFRRRAQKAEEKRNRYLAAKIEEKIEETSQHDGPGHVEHAMLQAEVPLPPVEAEVQEKRERDEDAGEETGGLERVVRRRLETLVCAIHGSNDEETNTEEDTSNVLELPKGIVCNSEEAQRAKKEELERFKKMRVYEVIRREEMTKRWSPTVVGVRWVITEKSYGLKARLVCKEYATKKMDKDTLFVGTPCLGALKMLISRVATHQERGYVLMAADIETAFLYAPVKLEVFIELPPEDERAKSGRYIG